MPFINSITSIPLSPETKELVKTRLGASMPLINKSETWLMVGFADNNSLYFKGNQDAPTAIITVSLFGAAQKDQYQELTREITSIFQEEAGIPSDRIYVKYEEVDHWGFNGTNF